MSRQLFEVESKFKFDHRLLSKFRSNEGFPRFDQLRFRSKFEFQDIYFDRGSCLSDKGIWLRERRYEHGPKVLEAKVRVSGDYTRSAFQELKDRKQIELALLHASPDIDITLPYFGLGVLADFKTSRDCYLADDRFSISLDSTNFGHSVGEVELEAPDIMLARSQIDSFMKKYSWFFMGGKPEGKLTAYFKAVSKE